jgi:hypothetical protein
VQPTVRLVRGDSLSYVELTMAYADGSPVDLSRADVAVTVRFRSPGSDAVLFTRPTTKVDGGVNGVVRLSLPSEAEGATAGVFDAEAEIDFDGQTQTIYEKFTVSVRERFL